MPLESLGFQIQIEDLHLKYCILGGNPKKMISEEVPSSFTDESPPEMALKGNEKQNHLGPALNG